MVPTLPPDAIVTVDFGFNGTNLTQVGATSTALAQGHCVNGTPGSIFGQVSFCNGTAFFQAAFRAEREGLLKVPSAGVSPDTGQACPTTRSFDLVDQDPSDNVTTTYLLTGTGQTAQYNQANVANLVGATRINNGSDNRLLDNFLDPTIGCTPYEAPDLSMGGTPGTSQGLDELSAAKNQAGRLALVPESDEMTLVSNAFSAQKTDLYRSNMGQPFVSATTNRTSSPAMFCQNMENIQTPVPGEQPGAAGNGHVAGAGGGQQPADLHGEPAEHVVHQPQLPELWHAKFRDGHDERRWRGGCCDLQRRAADGDQHDCKTDAGGGQRMSHHHHMMMNPSGM